jgi:hypothetical protein
MKKTVPIHLTQEIWRFKILSSNEKVADFRNLVVVFLASEIYRLPKRWVKIPPIKMNRQIFWHVFGEKCVKHVPKFFIWGLIFSLTTS